ncbi:MAG: 23S rRNA (adenine(2503)-C(2))-methyltransferase RlmN [Desulfobacterales bacterium]|nr:23S rRNA (adenine(2503)-C(2))-methyltransferase RlmN [Desulfobacterales bacterium]
MKILELTFNQLAETLATQYGKGEYHAKIICREVLKNGNIALNNIPEIDRTSPWFKSLKKNLCYSFGTVKAEKEESGTRKFVTELTDGLEIESVIIPMHNYKTLCISSQAGCRMGCTFCETGNLGLHRNLTVEEIVGQIFNARFHFGENIRNIVFMGMGEPFDNFDNVIQAIRVITDQRGPDIAPRHITISTVGRIDGLQKMAELNWPLIHLAISLNAPNDKIRSRIMPINNSVPMIKLRETLLNYPLAVGTTFFVEYVLIRGINDARAHAAELADYLRPLPVKVNLIPYNPGTCAEFEAPSEDEIIRFRGWLVDEHVFVRMRSAKGQNVMAACGQLGNGSFKME